MAIALLRTRPGLHWMKISGAIRLVNGVLLQLRLTT
jgi:hypothetical protein